MARSGSDRAWVARVLHTVRRSDKPSPLRPIDKDGHGFYAFLARQIEDQKIPSGRDEPQE